ncbi:MAG: hypothetical protein BWY32_01761 [bacterium ADurb.Bin243]|nr:MAG: hypothetical protein BWY32_01761 [bacterium ADurb.Bin243]
MRISLEPNIISGGVPLLSRASPERPLSNKKLGLSPPIEGEKDSPAADEKKFAAEGLSTVFQSGAVKKYVPFFKKRLLTPGFCVSKSWILELFKSTLKISFMNRAVRAE